MTDLWMLLFYGAMAILAVPFYPLALIVSLFDSLFR